MLTQILVDMRGQLVKAKQQVASAIADEKRLRDQADAEFKQLEKGAVGVSVDNQLLALKQKMGMLPAGAPAQNKALGAGQRDEEEIHAEIEHPTEEKGR
jgi:phage shock protein A